MELSKYKDLKEKEEIYRDKYRCIDKWSDLEVLLKESISSEGVFRGMNEASHKNYTSEQRYYITLELVKSGQKISNIIQEKVKNLPSLNNILMHQYFDIMGIEPNWYLLNSYLQHYGGKTPLLHFSKNPLVALYFLRDNIKESSEDNNNIQNEYVYCIDIHKSLVSNIRNYLGENSVNSHTLFPKEKQIAIQTFE